MKKLIYFHICCINNWREVVDNILSTVRDSGLYDCIDEIRCSVLGNAECLQDNIFLDEKIFIRFHSKDILLREQITLGLLHQDSQKENFQVLYLHSKGVSKPDNPNVKDWVDYMLFFNVRLYKIALQNLNHHDCYGVNFQQDHYSGNFWWSRSEYIKNLNELTSAHKKNPIAAELWLTSLGLENNSITRHCNWVSLWNSGVRHYRSPYPASDYESCVNAYDTRFKRLTRNFRYIVISNFKCGYSSSNLLETQKVLRIFPEDKVIFFYRNIFARVISVFINWCITDRRFESGNGWLLEHIARTLKDSDYAGFIDLFHKNRFEDAFDVFLGVLNQIFLANGHTQPQVDILRQKNVPHVDYFVEVENSDRFYEITKIGFPFDRTNESASKIKQSLLRHLQMNPDLQSVIRHLYQDDVDFFTSKHIDVDRL